LALQLQVGAAAVLSVQDELAVHPPSLVDFCPETKGLLVDTKSPEEYSLHCPVVLLLRQVLQLESATHIAAQA
jgi:hypothetical protein